MKGESRGFLGTYELSCYGLDFTPVLCSLTGIEASDLSSLLEQFEKSEGKET